MVIVEMATGREVEIGIAPVESKDFRQITKRRYFFDWKKERFVCELFKLTLIDQPDILGLAAVVDFPDELRLQIRLLCASRENVGKDKKYSGIAGCLIAYIGKLALRKYFRQACVSLVPKTELRAHYQKEYGMLEAGPQLYLDGPNLQAVINKYAA